MSEKSYYFILDLHRMKIITKSYLPLHVEWIIKQVHCKKYKSLMKYDPQKNKVHIHVLHVLYCLNFANFCNVCLSCGRNCSVGILFKLPYQKLNSRLFDS